MQKCVWVFYHLKRNEFIFGPHPIFSVDLSVKKFLEQLTGLAFPRKSVIQPENNNTHGASQSPLYVDNGKVIRVIAVDTPRLKKFVS